MKITAQTILDALAFRHTEDVFVPECKDGPSGKGYLRLDAWVMKKAWSRPLVTGYEIKISRSDFVNDKKWQGYLGSCNEFYFVCPHGLIKPEEVGSEAGLMYISKTGTRIYIKKKAPYRDVTIPECLFRYVLMARSKIIPPNHYIQSSKKVFWQKWMKKKEVNRDFGYKVSKAIAQRFDEEVEKVANENKNLQKRIGHYDELLEFLESVGIKPTGYWGIVSQMKSKLESIKSAVPESLERSLAVLVKELARFQQQISKIKEDEK